MHHAIFAPAVVLVLWTIVMLFWVVATRLPAMARAGLPLSSPRGGVRAQVIDDKLPLSVAWKSHNHMHLMEQPTLFYAVVLILAVAGADNAVNVQLAWAYVGIRIAHSLWQALVNIVPVRTLLFLLSTACLAAMAVNALRATLEI
ncbi:MAPEG family protein [Sphingomonas sp. GlSt437]|uniref:MAPEG family protein n=1 Tax=Sphingomonas sp. GlSt437 TaxID=3389970 RepID=UPI003A8BC4AF